MRLARVAVDSGDGENTMEVYGWARRHPGFVMAVKGRESLAAQQAIGAPSWQDVSVNGRKLKKGVRLWNIGTSMLELELYGQLGLEKPTDGEAYPDGYAASINCRNGPHQQGWCGTGRPGPQKVPMRSNYKFN